MSTALGDAFATASTTKRERYRRMRDALWSERATFDMHWRDLADFILPRRTRWFASDRNRGDKRSQNIIDSTATFSARTLQSGLHAGLTSPARPWFKLTTPDPDLAAFKPVQEWLEVVTQRMRVIFTDTNLYNTLPLVYGDMGVFGTAAMALLEDEDDLFRTYSYPIGSYALGLDRRGLATSFVRDYELTVLQVVQEFGVKKGYRDIDWGGISPMVKDAWDKGDYENPIPITWVVTPNADADSDRIGGQFLPWSSCHFEFNEARDRFRFLRESGFRTFPIMAPRWEVTGEDNYGTNCPGMTALGDIRQLQIMHRKKGQAIAKMVDPPMVGLPELRSQKTSIISGDITYVREPQHGFKAAHEVTLNIEHLGGDIADVQYRIQRAFYEDLFLMLARSDDRRGAQPVTAREVEERHEEKLLALGPVLERTNDELLDPIVNRAYLLMELAGLIPEPPQEVHGVKLKVEYISIMAQAQALVGVVAQDRFLASVVPLVAEGIVSRHKIVGNQVVDNYQQMLGTDPRLVRSNEEADALAAAEAKAQQTASMAANAQGIARAAKDASQAKNADGSSVLDQVMAGPPPGTANSTGAPKGGAPPIPTPAGVM